MENVGMMKMATVAAKYHEMAMMSLLRPSRSRVTITRGDKKHLVEVVKAVDEVKAYNVYGKLRGERMN
uniref:Uncharacterized protein n=1 Tax=Aegilops tauschii TaxID=37682 RepID=M8CPU3_AEGTA